jgi:tetratricopeptide (TPR) repeat protein
MLPFKSCTPERRRLDARVSLAIGVGVFLLYLVTLSPGVFPGESGFLVAQSYGLEESGLPVRPLFTWLTHAWASIPLFNLALRMNLFSVVCVTLAAVLLYRLTAFFIYEVIYEDQAEDHAESLSWTSGVLAVVATMTSVPVWQAATRLRHEGFVLLLLLMCGSVLMAYAKTGIHILPYVAALLYGLCLPESAIFVTFTPIFVLGSVMTLWKMDRLSGAAIGWMVVWAAVGMALVYWVFGSGYLQSVSGQAEGYNKLFQVVVAMWKQQYQELRSLLPSEGWILMLLWGTVPWLATVLAAPAALNNERNWSLYIFYVIMTVLVIGSLLNVSMSPWSLYRTRGGLPVVSAAMVGMLAALMCAIWRLLWRARPSECRDTPPSFMLTAGQWMGRLLIWPIVAAIVVAAGINAAEAHGRRGLFADRFAGLILDQLGDREWMVTDGSFDAHLMIEARMRGQKLFLIGLQKDVNKPFQQMLKNEVEKRKLFAAVDMTRIRNTIDLGIVPFIQDWFMTDPDIGSKVAVFGVPDLWYGAGLNPVPEYLFFGGKKVVDQIKPTELLPKYEAFWDEVDRLLPRVSADESDRDQIERYSAYLRRHVGFLGNNLGVLFEELGADKEAYSVFTRMRRFDPENVSVLFNRFEMINRGLHPEDREAVEKEMKDMVGSLKQRYSLWSLSRYYGYVRSPELFARLGWSWAMSGQMGAGLAGIRRAMDLLKDTERDALMATLASIYAMSDNRKKSVEIYEGLLKKDPTNRQTMLSLARIAIQEGQLDTARNWMDKANALGLSSGMSMGLEFAALHLASGNLTEARLLLQQVTDSQPQNLLAWAMLCVVQIQQNQLEEVERVILPRMIKTCGTVDNYFVQVTRAQVGMKKGKNFYLEAREAFLRAARLRPDVAGVKDMILQLDIWLNDKDRAEIHARQVLRVNRNHALANYVMGHLRLTTRQYGEAEDYLRRSVEAGPTLASLNDYAECLHRMKRYDDAERTAREAITKNPKLYIVWETLASILMDTDRLDEAEEALNKSLALDETDIRTHVSMARLQLRKGNVARVRELVSIIRQRQAELPEYELGLLQELIAGLEKR